MRRLRMSIRARCQGPQRQAIRPGSDRPGPWSTAGLGRARQRRDTLVVYVPRGHGDEEWAWLCRTEYVVCSNVRYRYRKYTAQHRASRGCHGKDQGRGRVSIAPSQSGLWLLVSLLHLHLQNATRTLTMFSIVFLDWSTALARRWTICASDDSGELYTCRKSTFSILWILYLILAQIPDTLTTPDEMVHTIVLRMVGQSPWSWERGQHLQRLEPQGGSCLPLNRPALSRYAAIHSPGCLGWPPGWAVSPLADSEAKHGGETWS